MWDMMVKKMPGGAPKMGFGGASKMETGAAPRMGFGGAPKTGFEGMNKGALLGAVQATPASPMMQSAIPQGPINEEMLAARFGGPMKSASPWGSLLSKK